MLENGKVWSYKTKRFLKPAIDKDGYLRYTLSKDKKVKNQALHRWLWITFKGDIPDGMQINHIDGKKMNNNLWNLSLVTPKQNSQHAWGVGLHRKMLGSECSTSKLTEKDIEAIFELSREGYSQAKIAQMYCVSPSNISNVLNRNTWNHVEIKD